MGRCEGGWGGVRWAGVGWGEGEHIRPGTKTRCNPWQEALREVHCVRHPYDCQAAALPHWPLKQVVQHLHHSGHSSVLLSSKQSW